jgi:hypothetical protein
MRRDRTKVAVRRRSKTRMKRSRTYQMWARIELKHQRPRLLFPRSPLPYLRLLLLLLVRPPRRPQQPSPPVTTSTEDCLAPRRSLLPQASLRLIGRLLSLPQLLEQDQRRDLDQARRRAHHHLRSNETELGPLEGECCGVHLLADSVRETIYSRIWE